MPEPSSNPASEDANARYRALVESVADYAILMLDPTGHVVSWNKGAERTKGYRADEIIGQSFERFYTPEDLARGRPARLLARAVREGRVEDEGWRVRKDGTRFWADVIITPMYDAHDELTGFSKVTRDLTERKRSEDQRRQFELLVRSVTDYAILMLSPEGRIASWNRGAQHLKGYTEDEIIGQPYERFFLPADVAAGKPRALLARALTDGHVEDEGWRIRKDGSRFWALAAITALYDEAGVFMGYGKVTRDLTERKHMEDLAAEAARLQASNKLKSEFMANMSHELRTPLNSIIGYTELVLTDDELTLDEVNAGNLQTVLRNGRHLLSLINEVLDLAKIESGQLKVHHEPFDPLQLAKAVLSTARPLAEKKGLSLELQAQPGVELVVSDELKVRQILLNLVGNAVKFTPAGHVRVLVEPKGDRRFLVHVEDTGIGIPADQQELVFHEFQQVDASTTREHGGTGLGLSISRKLAELLGGTLALASVPGQGSTFTLELPREPLPEAPPAAPPAPLVGPAGAHLPDGDGLLVLAIDDEPEVLHLIAENLRHTRYRVATARGGEEGLRLAIQLHPAVITLDVMMPHMDGWNTLRRLKANPATAAVPVVLLSFIQNRGLAFSLGAAEYLSKPIQREDLVSVLDRLCSAIRPSGHVLVIDDDPDARGLYRQILQRQGLVVVEAADGEEGMARIAAEVPSLVILDLMMPKVDGFEVLARLRANEATRHLPVMVVTAKELTDEDVARLAGADRVLEKSVELADLLGEDLPAVLAGVLGSEER